MKTPIRIISMSLSLVLSLMLISSPISLAKSSPLPESDTLNNPYLISVETISREELFNELPPETIFSVYGRGSNSAIVPFGLDQPTKLTHKHDLSISKYTFEVKTVKDSIYSTKTFIGHDGKFTVYLDEYYSASKGNWTFSVYALGTFWDAKKYTYSFPHGAKQTLRLTCDPDDILYLKFDPNGQRTRLSDSSYIKKGH